MSDRHGDNTTRSMTAVGLVLPLSMVGPTSLATPRANTRANITVSARQSVDQKVDDLLAKRNLGYYDNDAHFVVSPGAFDVFVGDSSVGLSPGAG